MKTATLTQCRTLHEFMSIATGSAPQADIWLKFTVDASRNIPLATMRGRYLNGDYTLTPEQLKAGETLADQILQLADALHIDIRAFADIGEVMGFDTNPRELTSTELGAYLIGQALANHTSLGAGGFESRLTPVFRLMSNRLAIELGRQVYGDNFPEKSATDTLTDASMEPVKAQL